jgi:hypothetical protein
MRLVKVKAPEGQGREVARLAHEAGIESVSFNQVTTLGSDGSAETKDTINADTSTPKAKAFAAAVLAAPFFDPEKYSIEIRQPRSVVSRESVRGLTWPLSVPAVDIYEELWQFSHVTASFVGRMLIGAVLLSYGMLEQNLLLMVAGLLFLPLLPTLLAVSFGALSREWRLAAQGLFAFAVATALIVAGGAIVAAVVGPPLRYHTFSGTLTAAVVSTLVGVAASLADADDVGRREMIGLAATAQVALIPAWLGISLVIGFSQAVDPTPPSRRLLTFAVIVAAITVASLITYAVLGFRGRGLNKFAARA